jgi:hypothetical protein
MMRGNFRCLMSGCRLEARKIHHGELLFLMPCGLLFKGLARMQTTGSVPRSRSRLASIRVD